MKSQLTLITYENDFPSATKKKLVTKTEVYDTMSICESVAANISQHDMGISQTLIHATCSPVNQEESHYTSYMSIGISYVIVLTALILIKTMFNRLCSM